MPVFDCTVALSSDPTIIIDITHFYHSNSNQHSNINARTKVLVFITEMRIMTWCLLLIRRMIASATVMGSSEETHILMDAMSVTRVRGVRALCSSAKREKFKIILIGGILGVSDTVILVFLWYLYHPRFREYMQIVSSIIAHSYHSFRAPLSLYHPPF